LIRNHKPESTRVRRETADDEVHLLGQSVSIAANLKEVAGGDQCLQPASEAGALVARYAQHPHQIPHRGRMMGVLPYLF
jgi:hypothetical protein